MTQEYQDTPHRALIMIRYGKIVFPEETFQSLGLTEKTSIRLGFDDTCSTYFINILANYEGSLKLKKSGIYHYVVCVDLLKALGLYSPHSTIYELIKESESNGESIFKLIKIAPVKDFNISSVLTNKDELRSVLAMINAKI